MVRGEAVTLVARLGEVARWYGLTTSGTEEEDRSGSESLSTESIALAARDGPASGSMRSDLRGVSAGAGSAPLERAGDGASVESSPTSEVAALRFCDARGDGSAKRTGDASVTPGVPMRRRLSESGVVSVSNAGRGEVSARGLPRVPSEREALMPDVACAGDSGRRADRGGDAMPGPK